ncbi:MAG: DUF928 domain-containing protein [Cyanobacteria bacterium J06648_16]
MQLRIFRTALLLQVGLCLGLSVASPALARRVQASGPREGLPGRRISGGSRLPDMACVAGSEPLVALLPESNLGLSTEAMPTLWFYLPETEPSRLLEFTLYDETGRIYATYLTPPATAGLVGVDLDTLSKATAVPTLTKDSVYRWTFSIVCNPNNRSEDYWVQGWLQQIELNESVENTDQQWLAAVDTAANRPQVAIPDADITSRWQALIQMAGLDQAISMPLVRQPVTLQPASVEISFTNGYSSTSELEIQD